MVKNVKEIWKVKFKNENGSHPFSVEILNDWKRGTRSKTEFLSETKCSKMNE